MRLTAASPQERTRRALRARARHRRRNHSTLRADLGLRPGRGATPPSSGPASATVTVIATTAERPNSGLGCRQGRRSPTGCRVPAPKTRGDSFHPFTAPPRPKRRRGGSAANREPDGSAHAAACTRRGLGIIAPSTLPASTRHCHRPGILGCYGAPRVWCVSRSGGHPVGPYRHGSARRRASGDISLRLITAETPFRFAHSDRLQ